MYETFEVLDYNGEPCLDLHVQDYDRDQCLEYAIQRKSNKEVGCTTPYSLDKSNICTDIAKARNASIIYKQIALWNYTKANELCPKTCLQYMISFSNKEWDYYDYTTLSMEFPKFVRVSRSTYSYTLLELIAEVGGYVGLFLGVSINQVSDLFKHMVTKISSSLYKN